MSVIRAGVCIALILVIAMTPAVRADTVQRSDPDDSPGALDIETIGHGHERRGLVTHRITTYEPWDNTVLSDPKNDFSLSIVYGTRYNKYRRIIIDVAPDGSLFGWIDHPTKEMILAFVRVWRIDERTIEIAIPVHSLADLGTYRWTIASLFHEETHAECSNDGAGHRIICVDRAPNRGYVIHRR